MYIIFIIYCLGLISIHGFFYIGICLWKNIKENEKLRKLYETKK